MLRPSFAVLAALFLTGPGHCPGGSRPIRAFRRSRRRLARQEAKAVVVATARRAARRVAASRPLQAPSQTPEQAKAQAAALAQAMASSVSLDHVVAIINDGIVTESELEEAAGDHHRATGAAEGDDAARGGAAQPGAGPPDSGAGAAATCRSHRAQGHRRTAQCHQSPTWPSATT